MPGFGAFGGVNCFCSEVGFRISQRMGIVWRGLDVKIWY